MSTMEATGRIRIEQVRTAPETIAGIPCWSVASDPWRICFVGRGAPPQAEATQLKELIPDGTKIAWPRQVHSARLVEARRGSCGDADALVLREGRLAAVIATADCVPIMITGQTMAVAVHAGWRGLAAGIIARAAEEIADQMPLRAWIGPSIGPCCYEVGEDVARSVYGRSGVVMPLPVGKKLLLDLRRAAIRQLENSGVSRVDCLDWCTRCAPDWLASYRRDGPAAGRNLALIWRE